MGKIARLFSAVTLLFVTATFISCTNNSVKNSAKDIAPESVQKEQIKSDVSEFVYPLPTGFEVTEMLQRIGASYILSLSNPVENAEKYFTEKKQALNLGIYSADLSYASTYNQRQSTIDYIKASNHLIEELGISEVVDMKVFDDLQKFENNKDTVIDMITNTFFKTYSYLNRSGRASVSVLIVAGSWVEALYITTHISEDTYNNVEMVKLVMDQKKPLNKLMEIMEQHKENKSVAETIDLLTNINNIYQSLDDGSISKEQMKKITKEIAKVRNTIVE